MASDGSSDLDRLHEFARRGQIDGLQDLLSKNKTLTNQKANFGFTALHWAAQCGHEDIVRYLLQNGAQVDAINSNGDTALHLSAWKDHPHVASLLLKFKANKNIKNQDGKIPLDLAHSDAVRDAIPALDHNEIANSIIIAQEEDDDEEW